MIVIAHSDVVNILLFESEIISSVSVIVTYLGAFASCGAHVSAETQFVCTHEISQKQINKNK